ncbi:NAD-dependent epimerase/dehydratase family protein, partial [bacterium]
MLGSAVVEDLENRGHTVVATSRSEAPESLATFDISNPMDIARLAAGEFGELDGVINCAAYTAVDKAESEEQAATDANGIGVSYLGAICMEMRLDLIHVSTDFVFDGRAEEPYTEDSPTNPLSAYGRSKLYGERALMANPYARVVRTAWLFGPKGRCFPRTMVEAYRAGKSLRVVADQRGNPTYVPDLACVLVDLLEK